jgi:hypothetical protein
VVERTTLERFLLSTSVIIPPVVGIYISVMRGRGGGWGIHNEFVTGRGSTETRPQGTTEMKI